ncbi:TetR/AcrR family transcriptional regulator [Nocardiopsis mangrovi]|uniref:TetR/AcrR family transcriptional regulator n=1 Tax=Nocardiopsis mangrovi TaxID=1179818 RepID=A0ABV9DX54_9ACTN
MIMTADLSPHDARSPDRTLTAAAEIFARHGMHGPSMAVLAREITGRTGGDVIAFRRAYPTRLDLVYAVALDATRSLVAAQTTDSGGIDPAATRLGRLVRRHVAHCWEHRTAEELRRTLQPTLRAINPARHRELSALRRDYRGFIRDLIGDGMAEGDFRVADPAAASGAVLDTLDSTFNWYDGDGGMSVTELGDVCVDLIVHHQLGAERG